MNETAWTEPEVRAARWVLDANLNAASVQELLTKPANKRNATRRRIFLAHMGAMPPDLASKFTEGERAVLAIIAIDVYRHGYCRRRSPEIAALAGMAAARPAIRAAEELGLLTARLNNRDSTIEIVSPKWAAWLTPYHGDVTSKARPWPPALGKAKAGRRLRQ